MATGYVLFPVIRSSSMTNQQLYEYGVATTDNRIICGYADATPLQAVYAFRAGGSSTANFLTFDLANTYHIAFGSGGQSPSGVPDNTTLSSRGTYAGVSYMNLNAVFIPVTLSSLDPYNSFSEAMADILNSVYTSIRYNSGLVGVAGPKFVLSGSEVTAYVTTPRGVTVTQDDITVKKSDVTVPFNYQNGVLTFTA